MRIFKLTYRSALLGAAMTYGMAQTAVDLRTQSKSVDFSGASSTKPSKAGTSLPATCSVGEMFLNTSAAAGQNLYVCTTTNGWSVQGGAMPTIGGDASGTPADLTVTGIQGHPVSGVAPASGQVLTWNATTAQWTPNNPTGVSTGAAYSTSFTTQTSVTIAGTAHQLNTANLLVTCYDTETPEMEVEPDTISVNPLTYDVTVNFATAQSGRCVVSSGGSGGGSGASLSTSNVYSSGAKQTMAASSTTAGLSLTPAPLPTSPVAGDLAVDANDNNTFKTFNGSSWVAGAGGGGAYASSFTSQTAVTIPGTAHQLNTANLVVYCYDTETPAMEVDPDTVSVNLTTYDVTINFATAQSGRCVVSSGGSGSGGSGSGGSGAAGATMAAQLGDLAVVSSGANTLTIGPNCSTATPCNVKAGNQTYSYTTNSTVTLTSGTGTAYFYVDANGLLTVGHNLALTCTAPCVAVSGVTGFPANSVPLFTWLATNNTWNNGSGTDYRAFLSAQNIAAGTGLALSTGGPQTSVGVDTAVVPTYLIASGTLNFATIAAGACTTDQTFGLPGANPGDPVASGWPALPGGLLGTMWVSGSGTLSVRLCNLSAAPVSTGSSVYTAAVVRSF